MTAIFSRALVALAAHGLGDDRREWGLAMRAEFEAAVEDGKPLRFAIGCLACSWRQMPAREEGRFVLASHLLAIGFLIPVAAVLIWDSLIGVSNPRSAVRVGLSALADGPNRAAVPSLVAVLLLLGLGHLRLAWVMLERDWERVRSAGMLNAAASMTLVAIAGAMFLRDAGFLLEAAILTAAELAAVAALAQWHALLHVDTPPCRSSA